MRYKLTALGATGIEVHTMQAQNLEDLHAQAVRLGLSVISVKRRIDLTWERKKKFPLIIFCQELIALLDAGLTIVEATSTLAEKEQSVSVQDVLVAVQQALAEGTTLSVAFRSRPEVFPVLFVETIRASEKSGAVREALERYVAYQKQVDILRDRIVSASIYPAVLLLAGIAVTAFLLLFVVPRFSAVYVNLGSDLPWGSRLLMHWGELVSGHGAILTLALILMLAVTIFTFTRSSVRGYLQSKILSLWIIREHVLTYQLSRLYRTVGMLLCGGMPFPEALRLSQGMLPIGMQPKVKKLIEIIEQGGAVAESFQFAQLVTPVATRLLRVAERGGDMGEMMERIASFYDDSLDRNVDWLTRVIEPVMMLIIGLVIGMVVVLMYFPIFELAGSIQ